MSDEKPAQVLQHLLASQRTIQIASISDTGQPNISYAPYVRDEQGAYYIFISQLASHTRDLSQTPKVAIMLAEDEQNTRQIFARTRLTYHCQVTAITPQEAAYASILDRFEQQFGSIIGVLRKLPDFTLFRLTPESGRFVMGFGQAYTLTGEGLQTLQAIGPP